jgi:hypothetical protein
LYARYRVYVSLFSRSARRFHTWIVITLTVYSEFPDSFRLRNSIIAPQRIGLGSLLTRSSYHNNMQQGCGDQTQGAKEVHS